MGGLTPARQTLELRTPLGERRRTKVALPSASRSNATNDAGVQGKLATREGGMQAHLQRVEIETMPRGDDNSRQTPFGQRDTNAACRSESSDRAGQARLWMKKSDFREHDGAKASHLGCTTGRRRPAALPRAWQASAQWAIQRKRGRHLRNVTQHPDFSEPRTGMCVQEVIRRMLPSTYSVWKTPRGSMAAAI